MGLAQICFLHIDLLMNIHSELWAGLFDMQTAPLPTITMVQTPVSFNDTVTGSVYKGQTFLVTAKLTIPTGSQNTMTFDLKAPPGSVLDIVAMDVVFTGSNLPCTSKIMFSTNYTTG